MNTPLQKIDTLYFLFLFWSIYIPRSFVNLEIKKRHVKLQATLSFGVRNDYFILKIDEVIIQSFHFHTSRICNVTQIYKEQSPATAPPLHRIFKFHSSVFADRIPPSLTHPVAIGHKISKSIVTETFHSSGVVGSVQLCRQSLRVRSAYADIPDIRYQHFLSMRGMI